MMLVVVVHRRRVTFFARLLRTLNSKLRWLSSKKDAGPNLIMVSSRCKRMADRWEPTTPSHFGRGDRSNREVLGFCAQEVDRVMSVLVQHTKSRLLAAVKKMEVQLLEIEGSMRFLVGSPRDPSLTAMDFTFARFALNMAMVSGRTLPEVMLNAGVPTFLAGMLFSSNPLMAHHQACQRALGLTGVIQPLVRLCFISQSPAVLTQTCIALAQLSRYIPNKPIVAGKGGVAATVGLLESYRREERITLEVVERAFTTLVNVMHRSDANRGLAEECGMTGPTLTIMDAVDDESVLVQAYLCLANLVNNALNQAHVGASSAIELAVTACKHCDSPRVVRAAALALCSMTLKHSANKSRCASFDAIPILLEIGAAWGVASGGDGESNNRRGRSSAAPRNISAEEEVAAAAQAIRCVVILIKHLTNALAMKRVGGLRNLIEIIHESEHNEVMIAAAKAVVILTPDPYALVRTFRNDKVSEVVEAGAYDALVRAREWAFARTSPPSWLKYGLEVLGCGPEGYGGASAFLKPEEFFTHSEFFEERDRVISPDVTLTQDKDLGGMLFHIS